jgi:intein/homing endonuclease
MNIFEICKKKLEEKGLSGDKRYLKRLKWEQEEILAKDKENYFQNLYERKIKYPFNQNNILICWLLDIVPDFNIEKDPKCEYGEFPDTDIDYSCSTIRSYIKEEWSKKTFGEEYVCNIGNYTTFGLKSALIDMARVHGLPREEILALTKSLDAKDDEGNAMTWDAAMKLYPDLKKYCEDHPDVAEASKKLLNRNRGMGVHAGGLIISSSPLPDLVPLVKRKDNPQASAWVEGLHGQDLQPVGLIKFDLLIVSNLLQIAKCCELVKKRHNLKGICALEGQSDWTDVDAWRSDPLSLGMANLGDLKGIFQFDSDTVRNMCRSGGVDKFEDLVAYTSLNRPAALDMKMQDRYIQRKKGKEEYHIHPLLEPILGGTYGVMCVHEDTLVSMYDGTERKISELSAESLIHTFNEDKKTFESKKIIWAGYTKTDSGKLIKLKNGFEIITTNDHKILTYNGWKNAEDLKENDLVAIPNKLSKKSNKSKDIANWLGKNEDVAYLIGLLIGDGSTVKGSTSLSTGIKKNNNKIKKYLIKTFPNLKIREYFNVRSWYLYITTNIMANNKKYGNRKTKLNVLLDNLDMRRTCYSKKVPEVIMKSNVNTRRAFLAGLYDADGTLSKTNRSTMCAYTSVSNQLLHDVRKLLLLEGIQSHFSKNRLYIWNTKGFAEIINKYSVIKKIKGGLLNGLSSFKVPREYLFALQKSLNLSRRQFEIKTGINKQNFLKRRTQNINLSTLKNSAPKSNLLYVEVQEIKNVYNKKFYDISVNDNHNFVANGIVVHNCYQEQVMKILNVVGNIPLKDCELVRKAISKKKLENFIKYKEMFIINGQKNLNCSEKEINELYNQVEAFSGYGFNLGHATAYTYISSYLLYLKSHYPHEFYSSILSCETLSDKIKEYKTEAKLHNVKVCRLDINKSKVTFDLQDKEIYFGLSNVKGIGEGPATRIVQHQPYSGFEDFLERFGTEANVLKPLIGLRCFNEKDPITLWKFADVYKTFSKKIEDKKKRHYASMEKCDEEFKEFFPDETMKLSDIKEETPYESSYWKKYDKDESNYVESTVECSKDDDGAFPKVVNGTVTLDCGITIEKEIVKYYKKVKIKKNWNRLNAFKNLWNKRKRSLEKYSKISEERPRLEDFDSSQYSMDSDLEEEFNDPIVCENKYYGFAWVHPLEFSPDYKGNLNFDNLKSDPHIAVSPVELLVIKATQNKSKKGAIYYQVLGEDSTGQQNKINIWQDDWERWSEEFVEGNLLRVRLQPPSNGFATFTLENNQGKLKWRGQKKYIDKKDDIRVFVMRKGSQEDFMEQK